MSGRTRFYHVHFHVDDDADDLFFLFSFDLFNAVITIYEGTSCFAFYMSTYLAICTYPVSQKRIEMQYDLESRVSTAEFRVPMFWIQISSLRFQDLSTQIPSLGC